MDSINYEELAREVIKQQQGKEQAPQDHKEAVISVLREKTIAEQKSPTFSTTTQYSPIQQTAGSDLKERGLPSYAEGTSPEIQNKVEELITHTLDKGLSAGISEVAGLDPFIIDMYHDALAEHVVQQMKERGIL